MKRLFLLIVLLWVKAAVVQAQQDTTTFFGKSNYIFQHLDKSQITTGLMSDYGIEFMDLSKNDGVNLDPANYVGLQEWRLLYASLYSTQINGLVNMEYLDVINTRVLNYIALNQPNTFTVMHFNYQSMRTDALSANLISVYNDQMYDVAGRSQSPYQNNQIFAVSPIRQAIVQGNNSFIFRSDMFFSNTGKTISNIGVDVGESGNYQNASMNTPFDLTFNNEGFVPIKIRISYTDGTQVYAHTKVLVTPYPEDDSGYGQSANKANSGTQRFGPGTGNYISNEIVSASKSYLGSYANGDITIQLSSSNATGQIRKPLIIVEGFDMDNSYNFRNFTTSIRLNENSANSSYINLNDQLDDVQSYDLIFLNFSNATDYIQRNAFLLEKVIEIVNARKTTFNGTRQGNVVMGLSMGGLVGRYALRDMEQNSLNHEARLFITHDTPHHGANIPVGFQAAVQHLAPFQIFNAELTNGFPFVKKIGWVDMFPEIVSATLAFNSPAAKQMLIQRYTLSSFYNLSADNSASQSFFNELNNMGWPQLSKNLTLSNGNCNGELVFPANSRIFDIIGERQMSYGGNLWRSALMSIAAPIAPIAIYGGNVNPLSLLVQFPLSLISTKSSVNLDFRVNAVPDGGVGEVYRGDLYIKRKLAWIFNSTSYILKTRINSIPGTMAIDNAPGGVYNMISFGINPNLITAGLPDFFSGTTATIHQPRFCFVPTVSALAVNNPWQNLKSNICNSINCINPVSVKNFYASSTNTNHISFSQEASNWLLQWQDPSFDCSKICPTSLAISGPNTFCSSGTYTVTNLPANTSITWVATPSYAVSIIANGSSAQVTKLTDGFFTLSAQINAPCTFNVSKVIFGGIDMINGMSFMNTANEDPYFCTSHTGNHFNIVTMNEQTNLTFEIRVLKYPNLNLVHTQMGYGTDIPMNFIGSPGYYVVEARVIDQLCGQGEWYGTEVEFVNCAFLRTGGEAYKVYPNPVNTSLTIEPNEIQSNAKMGTPQTFKYRLYDSKSRMLVQGDAGRDGKSNIDTGSIPNGTYFLHILQGKTTIKKQIIVSH